MAQASKREQVIDVALKLFYKEGFHATGVEKIREEAGVSKKTLYNHFKSKDELILAVLRRRDEQFRNNLMRRVEQLGKTPVEKLEAIFDFIDEWFKSEFFWGCMFINASAEFTDMDNPHHVVCAEHKRLVHKYIEKLGADAGVKNPNELAEQLNLLIEGAIVQAHVSGDSRAADRAREIGVILINNSLTSH